MRRPSLSIEAGDIPARLAAFRMGLTQAAFRAALPDLLSRGFPPPDITTGNFDLEAIDAWRRKRHAGTFYDPNSALDAEAVVARNIQRTFGRG